jgi:hypothetical protein
VILGRKTWWEKWREKRYEEAYQKYPKIALFAYFITGAIIFVLILIGVIDAIMNPSYP